MNKVVNTTPDRENFDRGKFPDCLSHRTQRFGWRSDRAFTLIELLVVMAIFTILASLLIPSMSGALASARKAKCASNLGQIGKAVMMFAADNKGYFYSNKWVGAPVMNQYYTPNSPPAISNGDGYLLPYLEGDKTALVCPGSYFPQGVEAFYGMADNHWVKPYGPCTYQGFTTFWESQRKITRNHLWSQAWDPIENWDEAPSLPIFMDPLVDVGGWAIPGGLWDQDGMVVHDNEGTLPVLFDDGHVMMFMRNPLYGELWGSDPYTGGTYGSGYAGPVNDMLGM